MEWYLFAWKLEGIVQRLAKVDHAVYIVLSSQFKGVVHRLLAGGASLNFWHLQAIQDAIRPRYRGPGWILIINDSLFGHYPAFDICVLTTTAIPEPGPYLAWGGPALHEEAVPSREGIMDARPQ